MPKLALLAGGLATRLRPLTEEVSKSMLPVAGEPFIAHQLRLLSRQGIHEVVICAGYLGEQVRRYLGDGSAFGCQVNYVFDGDKLKGTGGAIKGALPLLGDHFFVMYGDSYLPTSFDRVLDFYHSSGMPGLMTIFHNENKWDVSNVEFREGRIVNYDKRSPAASMKYIDYGLGILRAECLSAWRDDEVFDLARVYESLVAKGELAGLEIHERFFEIGSHEGLAETNGLLLEVQRERAESPDAV